MQVKVLFSIFRNKVFTCLFFFMLFIISSGFLEDFDFLVDPFGAFSGRQSYTILDMFPSKFYQSILLMPVKPLGLLFDFAGNSNPQVIP